MEIKQGDKVRVSKDVPKMYVREWAENRYCNVAEVEDDNAIISDGSYILAIPTKYLIKVDAEEKEPKYKVGDIVRINHHVPYMGHNGRVGRVNFITKEGRYCIFGVPCEWDEEYLEPYTEPKEQAEAGNSKDDISEKTANEISNILEAYAKTLSGIADSSDWARYEADLAKEVVLKTVNTAFDKRPEKVAEYAVQIAKSVVEGLKRK